VFIEVKTRSNFKYGMPSEAVNKIKRQHIFKCVKYYAYINKIENKIIRFDVIEVYYFKNKYCVNHIKQVDF